jgi:hypothetical protein
MKHRTIALCAAASGCSEAMAREGRCTLDLGVVFGGPGAAVVDGPIGIDVPTRASLNVASGTAAQASDRYMLNRRESVLGTCGMAWVRRDPMLADAAALQPAHIGFRPVVVAPGVV